MPKGLEDRTQPLPNQGKSKYKGAAKDGNDRFQSSVKAKRSNAAEGQTRGDRTSESEACHEAGQNQSGGPDRIPESESAQPELKSLKKKSAASGEKKNERDKGYAHEFERCSVILGIANATDSYVAALPVSSRRY